MMNVFLFLLLLLYIDSMYRNIIKDSCNKMLKMLEFQHCIYIYIIIVNMGVYKIQFLTVKMQCNKSIKEINLEGMIIYLLIYI